MKKFIKITVWTLTFGVTLIVLFYAEENWRGARAWRKTTAELQAKGYPLTLSEIIPPPVADDDNIAAAPIFAELFTAGGDLNVEARLVKISHRSKSLFSPKKDVLPTDKKLGDLRLFFDQPNETLTVNQAAKDLLSQLDQEWMPLLAEVHAALQRQQCRWPLAYERGFEMPIPHLTHCLELTKILKLRAACYLEIGETQKAAADLDDVFKLAQAMESHPFLIDYLVAVTGLNLALPVFWSGIVNHQWREEDLVKLQQTFATQDRFEKFKQALINDHVAFQSVNFRDKKQFQDIRSINEQLSKTERLLFWLWEIQPRGRLLLDKCLVAEWLQDNLRVINTEEQTVSVELCLRNKKQMEAQTLGLKIFAHPIARSAVGTYMSVIRKMTQTEVACRQAILACALERYRLRHGKLPLTLSELTPDFIEKIPNQVTVSDPMIYRRVSDSDYVLYSIGWNLRDDGGTISDDQRADQLDWVWASKPELYQRKKVEK